MSICDTAGMKKINKYIVYSSKSEKFIQEEGKNYNNKQMF